MKDIVMNVLTVFGCLLVSALLVFAYQMLHVFLERLKQKTNNDTMKLIIDKLDYIVKLCVEATNQTFVDDLKLSDNFDKTKQEEAFKYTTTAIENMLTDDDRKKIVESFGDVDTFVKMAIENYIKNSKETP
jgi:hypothetical protein